MSDGEGDVFPCTQRRPEDRVPFIFPSEGSSSKKEVYLRKKKKLATKVVKVESPAGKPRKLSSNVSLHRMRILF